MDRSLFLMLGVSSRYLTDRLSSRRQKIQSDHKSHANKFLWLFMFSWAMISSLCRAGEDNLRTSVEQITSGPSHHFFGYIGQSQTIPWNSSGRYIVALRTSFHDRMPAPDDAADIVLIDTAQDNEIIPVDKTKAWNFQQGTMLYWNPQAPETQFFFNDRDEHDRVFTVLYDTNQKKRIHEYRYTDTPVGNSGVAQNGKYFLALNYGRLAQLRPVTGYPQAFDWTTGLPAPQDDGIFIVDVQSGEKRLLVSFRQLAELLQSQRFIQGRSSRLHVAPAHEPMENVVEPDVSQAFLYINHTLWNRADDCIYFFLRGRREKQAIWLDVPCTIKPDGSDLTLHSTYIGGHPEWGQGSVIVGAHDQQQVLYDVQQKQIVGQLGSDVFANPGGDIALSPNGAWFVNGYSSKDRRSNLYVFLHMNDGACIRTSPISRGPYIRGELRIDPAPRWNRTSDAVLVPGWTAEGTRQLFVVRIEGEIGRHDKGRLIYECSMASPQSVAGWRMEGPGKTEFKDGWMHIYSPEEKWHHVFWCPQDLPDRFIAEWEMQNLEPDAGLCIVFFAAKGIHGQDIFDANLPKRDGTFGQYTKGEINSYHISYYANNPKSPARGDSHLRKNSGFFLLQTGPEGIPTLSTEIHKIKLIKDKAHIVMFVDERKIIDWTDDGNKYGAVLRKGKIGFRQMRWTYFRYRNFRVWGLKKKTTNSTK